MSITVTINGANHAIDVPPDMLQDFVYIGKYAPRKDGGKEDGSAVFTQDVKLEKAFLKVS